MRNSFSEIFNHPSLKGARKIAINMLDNYIDLRYTGNEYFLVKFLTCLDDYTTGDVLTEPVISEKFGSSKSYLKDFKKDRTQRNYDKYFRFLVSVLRFDSSDFNFKDNKKIDTFKKDIQHLVYRHFVSKNMIRDSKTKEMQFDAIVLTLHALTRLRYKDSANLQQYITNINPTALYTIQQLSERVSTKGYNELIQEQLRSGRASVQLGRIIVELNKGIKRDIEECQIAKIAIEAYLYEEKLSAKDFGNIFHDIYERFTIEYLAYLGIKCTYEA